MVALVDCQIQPMQEYHNDEELVTVFSSRTHLANVEAEIINSLLESAGIRCWIARENVVQQPVGNVMIKVLESQAAEAKDVMREAMSQNAGELE